MNLLPDTLLPPLRHSWNICLGQGRAAEMLRTDCVEHLARTQRALGFRYIRFHGLFHDEMTVVTRRPDGSLCFQWRMIDQAFDTLLSLGIRPFVELNPMPLALASGPESIFAWKLNITPPANGDDWSALVRAFTAHCVQRWGIDEVRGWYFEVWNEPNLAGFWSGTQADYFDLYRRAALAVKSVDASLRVGGPATAQGKWIPEMITFCAEQGVPLDFVSTHSYQQDELCFHPRREGSPHALGEYLLDQFKRVKAEVAASPLPSLEIHWTEWNSLTASAAGEVSWIDSPSTDALYAGAFALHHSLRADDLCDTLSWWIVSDVFGEHGVSPLPFSHTYGFLTVHGIPKATWHAFSWLRRMSGPRLALDGVPDDPRKQIVATREADGTLRVLCVYHPPMEANEGSWEDELCLHLDAPALVTRAQVCAGQGSAYETWRDWGCPPNLTPCQEEALRFAALPASSGRLHPAGTLRLPLHLQPHEILYIEIAPAEAPATNRGIYEAQRPEDLEQQLAAKSKE